MVISLAIAQLRSMHTCITPLDKVNAVVGASKTLFSALHLGQRKAEADKAGADDFLPVFIYVCLRARVPSVLANLEYVQGFRHPDALSGRCESWCHAAPPMRNCALKRCTQRRLLHCALRQWR